MKIGNPIFQYPKINPKDIGQQKNKEIISPKF